MYRIISSLTDQHSVWLVAVAGLLALLAGTASFLVLRRARVSRGAPRRNWIAAAAVVTGGGAWAAYFVALLGYDPGLPADFDAARTATSGLLGALGAGIGYLFWANSPRDFKAIAAGAFWIAGGLFALHYAGLTGMRVGARIIIDTDLVALSGLAAFLGVFLAGLMARPARPKPNLNFARRPRRGMDVPAWRTACAVMFFVIGVAALHVIGMGALSLTLDPSLPGPAGEISRVWSTVAVAVSAVSVLTLAITSAAADRSISSTRETASERLRRLAEASFEGLAIHDGELICDANERLCALIERPYDELVGMPVAELFAEDERDYLADSLNGGDTGLIETRVVGRDVAVPAEVQTRSLSDAEGLRITAVRDIGERRRSEARIRELADHDALTSLQTRQTFVDQLEAALGALQRRDAIAAVLHLDICGMSEINETAGLRRGDRVLAALGVRIAEWVDDPINACRSASDEFAVVLRDPGTTEALGERVEALREALSEPLAIEGRVIHPRVAIGVAVFPADGDTPETLLANAATAGATASEAGGDTISFYQPALDAMRRRRHALKAEIADAAKDGRIAVVYQPQADTRTGMIRGFEALVRLQRKDGAVLPAAEFVPLAEETGMILPLGRAVLRQACVDAAHWPEMFTIAVNISPAQFRDDGLTEAVAAVLEETKLAAKRLEIEITEGAVIEDVDRSREILKGLKRLGVQLAIDDFGTGYSSLSHLRRFPFDRLKIDRDFITGIDQDRGQLRLLRAILELARALDLDTLGEGVESEGELAALKREGCAQAQGFHIAKPMPAADVPAFLATYMRTLLKESRQSREQPDGPAPKPAARAS